MATIFDKILDGEIPCHRVYEDEHVLAFLDIGPLSSGHTLVIPKERKAMLHELSEESAAAIGRVLPKIARAVMDATGTTAYNVLQNNGEAAHQAVMHVHFHIIPKYSASPEQPRGRSPRLDGTGLGLKWNAGKLDPEEAKQLAERIKAAMG